MLCFDDKPDRFGEDAARTPMAEYECLGVPPPEENVPDENAEPAVPPSIASGDEGEEERADDALIALPSEYPPIDRGVELADPEPEPPSRRNSSSPLVCPPWILLPVPVVPATLPNATGSPPDPPPVLGAS